MLEVGPRDDGSSVASMVSFFEKAVRAIIVLEAAARNRFCCIDSSEGAGSLRRRPRRRGGHGVLPREKAPCWPVAFAAALRTFVAAGPSAALRSMRSPRALPRPSASRASLRV